MSATPPTQPSGRDAAHLTSETPAGGTLFGTRLGPRVLFVGFDEGDKVVERARQTIPTVEVAAGIHGDVRQAEWDVLVTRDFDESCLVSRPNGNEWKRADPHLFVLHWQDVHNDCVIERAVKSGAGASEVHVQSKVDVISNELWQPDGQLPATESIISETLRPAVASRGGRHIVFEATVASWDGDEREAESAAAALVTAFMTTGDKKALAGYYRRDLQANSECWLIPDDAGDLFDWLMAALQSWHDRFPERFPPVSDWRHEPVWRTPSEIEVIEEMEELKIERAATIAELDARALTLAQRLNERLELGDRTDRRLITAKGDDLVDAVGRALEEMGFEVKNVDAEIQGQKVEDLQVRDDVDPEWVALAEVRGYKGGAQVRDLLRIERFATIYTSRVGQPPAALWYVANQRVGRHPRERAAILAAEQPSLDAFAESGGLAIDTTDLFQLLMAVRSGGLERDSARRLLRSATGRWAFSS